MKIKIYIREGNMWVETERLSNPDGCTNIDTELPIHQQASGIKKLVEDILKLSPEAQSKLSVEVINLLN